jgi:hypothetical protein
VNLASGSPNHNHYERCNVCDVFPGADLDSLGTLYVAMDVANTDFPTWVSKEDQRNLFSLGKKTSLEFTFMPQGAVNFSTRHDT